MSRFVEGTKSPLPGVSDGAWRHFVAALEVPGFGSYNLRRWRLDEMGLQVKKGKDVHRCDYSTLVKSILMYHQALMRDELKRPEGVSMAGALAILHRGGRGALAGWPKLFPNTRALYEAAHGAF